MFKKVEQNINWKGGIAAYPNHYLMKKNRIIKLKSTLGKCEICGQRADRIYHNDEDKSNHSLENLTAVCHDCHMVLHSSRKQKTSKFKRLYGMTLREMAEAFGGSFTTYLLWHKENKLQSFLDSHNVPRATS